MSEIRLKSTATPSDALETIPGVGPSIARDLRDLGYTCVSDLRAENPANMYYSLCELRGAHIDRCVLYVFRCAVYYASHDTYDADLLKWWNWKDGEVLRRHGGMRPLRSAAAPARAPRASRATMTPRGPVYRAPVLPVDAVASPAVPPTCDE